MRRVLSPFVVLFAVLAASTARAVFAEDVAGQPATADENAPQEIAANEADPAAEPEEDDAMAPRYAGVPCVWRPGTDDEIHCGLFPLKQFIGLAWFAYVEPLKVKKLVETGVTAGLAAIASFKYDKTAAEVINAHEFVKVPGISDKFDVTNYQWQVITGRLEPLIAKLRQAKPATEKLGPRAFELLLKDVRDASIAAIIGGFDPHSGYAAVGTEGLKTIQLVMESQKKGGGPTYGGIGAVIDHFGSTVYVLAMNPRMPAAQKLERYDEIVAVEGKPVSSATEAVRALRGEPGTAVSLTVRRRGVKQGVSIVRDNILPMTVSAALYPLEHARVCYLFIGSFTESTPDEVRAAFAPNGTCSSADALVLDLHLNSGGHVGAMGKVAELLTPRNATEKQRIAAILVERSRVTNVVVVPDPEKSLRSWKSPILILQNSTTVSSAELLIGTLRPFAVLIGDRTFGKTSGWATHFLSDRSAVVLTGVSYAFKDGMSVEGQGFTPDIYFPRNVFSRRETLEASDREENLPRSRGSRWVPSADEALQEFIGKIHPELSIAIGLLRNPNTLASMAEREDNIVFLPSKGE